MASTLVAFTSLLNEMGSDVTYHREEGGTLCPCVSPEGFRSPTWHAEHPIEPVCNEKGMLNVTTSSVVVKASVQPLRDSRLRNDERLIALFGEIQQDDHVGVFPIVWSGVTLNFWDWSDSGEDYVIYDGRRFVVVAADKLPDIDGNPNHHWEVALRLLKPESERP